VAVVTSLLTAIALVLISTVATGVWAGAVMYWAQKSYMDLAWLWGGK
jgi:hypothetical protein